MEQVNREAIAALDELLARLAEEWRMDDEVWAVEQEEGALEWEGEFMKKFGQYVPQSARTGRNGRQSSTSEKKQRAVEAKSRVEAQRRHAEAVLRDVLSNSVIRKRAVSVARKTRTLAPPAAVGEIKSLKQLGLVFGRGLTVAGVQAGSAADALNIAPGARIISVNGRRVTSREQAEQMLEKGGCKELVVHELGEGDGEKIERTTSMLSNTLGRSVGGGGVAAVGSGNSPGQQGLSPGTPFINTSSPSSFLGAPALTRKQSSGVGAGPRRRASSVLARSRTSFRGLSRQVSDPTNHPQRSPGSEAPSHHDEVSSEGGDDDLVPRGMYVTTPVLYSQGAGWYKLVEGAHINGCPLWEKPGEELWTLYSTHDGKWALASSQYAIANHTPELMTPYQHMGALPQWFMGEWVENVDGAWVSADAMRVVPMDKPPAADHISQTLVLDPSHNLGGDGDADAGPLEGFEIGENLCVTQVTPGSAAEAAGIQVGSRVLAIDGVPVVNRDEALAAMSNQNLEFCLTVQPDFQSIHSVSQSLCPEKGGSEAYSSLKSVLDLRLFGDRLMKAWVDKPGTIFDELAQNLKCPPGVNAHQRIAEAADRLYHEKCKAYPGKNACQLLVMALYTMAGPDIDALMGFENVPVYSSDDPTEWNEYLKVAGKSRNSAIFSAINWASRTAVSGDAKQRTEAWETLTKWLKYISLLLALSSDPRGRGRGKQLWKQVNRKGKDSLRLQRLRAAVHADDELTEIFRVVLPKWEMQDADMRIDEEAFLACYREADPDAHREVVVARGIAGLPIEVVETHENMSRGQEIHWPAPSSCAFDRSVSESYIKGEGANALKAGGGGSILFLISNANVGLQLQAISQYPKEAELLLPPLSTFEIVESRTSVDLGFPIVEMDMTYTTNLGSTSLAAFCERGRDDSAKATLDMQRLLREAKKEMYPAGTPVEARVELPNGETEWRPASIIRAVGEDYLVDYRTDNGKRATAIVAAEDVKALPVTSTFREELAAQAQFAKNLFKEKTRVILPEHLDGAVIINQVIERVEKGSSADKIGLLEGTKIRRIGRINVEPTDTTEIIQAKLRGEMASRRTSKQTVDSMYDNSLSAGGNSPQIHSRRHSMQSLIDAPSDDAEDGVKMDIAVPKQAERIAKLEAALLLLQKRVRTVDLKTPLDGGGGPHPLTSGVRFVGNTVVEVEAGSPADAMGVKPGCRVEAVDGKPVPGDVEPDVLWEMLGGDNPTGRCPDVIMGMPDSSGNRETLDAYISLCETRTALIPGGVLSPAELGLRMGGLLVLSIVPGSAAEAACIPVGAMLCGLGSTDFADEADMSAAFFNAAGEGAAHELRFHHRPCAHEAVMAQKLAQEAAKLEQREVKVTVPRGPQQPPSAPSRRNSADAPQQQQQQHPAQLPTPSRNASAPYSSITSSSTGDGPRAPSSAGLGVVLCGTTVMSVAKSSAARAAGVTRGTRIYGVNGKSVEGEKEALAALCSAFDSGEVTLKAAVPAERPEVTDVDELQAAHAAAEKKLARSLKASEEERTYLEEQLAAEQARYEQYVLKYRDNAEGSGKEILRLRAEITERTDALRASRASMEKVREDLEEVSRAFGTLGAQHRRDGEAHEARREADAEKYRQLEGSAQAKERALLDASERFAREMEDLSNRLKDESAEAERAMAAKETELQQLKHEREAAETALQSQMREAKLALKEQLEYLRASVCGADPDVLELLRDTDDVLSKSGLTDNPDAAVAAESQNLVATITALRTSQHRLTEGLKHAVQDRDEKLQEKEVTLAGTEEQLAAKEAEVTHLRHEQEEAQHAMREQLVGAKATLRAQVAELREVLRSERTAMAALGDVDIDDIDIDDDNLDDGSDENAPLRGFEAETQALLKATSKLHASQQRVVNGLKTHVGETREKLVAAEENIAVLEAERDSANRDDEAAKRALREQIEDAKRALAANMREVELAGESDADVSVASTTGRFSQAAVEELRQAAPEGDGGDDDALSPSHRRVVESSGDTRELLAEIRRLRQQQQQLATRLQRKVDDARAAHAKEATQRERAECRAGDLEMELDRIVQKDADAQAGLRTHIAEARRAMQAQLDHIDTAVGDERGELRAALLETETLRQHADERRSLLEASQRLFEGVARALKDETRRADAATAALEREREVARGRGDASARDVDALRRALAVKEEEEQLAKEALRAQIREAKDALREQLLELRSVYGVDAAEVMRDLDGGGGEGVGDEARDLLAAVRRLQGSQEQLVRGLRRSLEEERTRGNEAERRWTKVLEKRDSEAHTLEEKAVQLEADLAQCRADLRAAMHEQIRQSTLEAMWDEVRRIHAYLDTLDHSPQDLYDKQTPRCAADMRREIRSARTRARHIVGGASTPPSGRRSVSPPVQRVNRVPSRGRRSREPTPTYGQRATPPSAALPVSSSAGSSPPLGPPCCSPPRQRRKSPSPVDHAASRGASTTHAVAATRPQSRGGSVSDRERQRRGSVRRNASASDGARSCSPPTRRSFHSHAVPDERERDDSVFPKWGISASGELFVDGGVTGYTGVRVVDVGPPAHPLLKANDVITHIDGDAVAGIDEFRTRLHTVVPGAWAEFTVRRWWDGCITRRNVKVRSMVTGQPPGTPGGRTIVSLAKSGAVVDVTRDPTARHRGRERRPSPPAVVADPLTIFTARSGSPVRSRQFPLGTDTDFSPRRTEASFSPVHAHRRRSSASRSPTRDRMGSPTSSTRTSPLDSWSLGHGGTTWRARGAWYAGDVSTDETPRLRNSRAAPGGEGATSPIERGSTPAPRPEASQPPSLSGRSPSDVDDVLYRSGATIAYSRNSTHASDATRDSLELSPVLESGRRRLARPRPTA